MSAPCVVRPNRAHLSRYCEVAFAVAAIVAAERGQPVQESGRFAAQFPVKPTPLAVLEQLDEDG